MDGNILGSSLVWVNDDTRPSVMDGETQFVSMSELPVPLLQASDEECPIGDFFRVSTNLYLFADSIIECIRELDPQAIETRETVVQGTSVKQKYWLTLIVRRLDAVDPTRTNLTLDHKRILPDRDIFGKRVYYERGLVLREDVPPDIHCFSDEYSGKLFFSTSLVSCARKKARAGFWPDIRQG